MIFGQNSLLKSLFSQSVFVFLYISKQRKKFFLCVSVYMWFFSKVRMWPIFFINHRPFFQVDDLTGFDCHRSSKVDQAFVYFFKSFSWKSTISAACSASAKLKPGREVNSNKWQEPVWSAALSQVVLAWNDQSFCNAGPRIEKRTLYSSTVWTKTTV